MAAGHAGAADGLHQRFLDDAVLHVQRQLAGTLLRGAPAHTVGKTGDVGDLLGLHPLALLRNGRRSVISALGHGTHMLNFSRIDHSSDLPFSYIVTISEMTDGIITERGRKSKKHSKHLV
jgi:hypothetical protein